MNDMKPVNIAVMGFKNGHCYYLYQSLLKEPNVKIVAVCFEPRYRIIYENRFGVEAFDGVDIFYDAKEMLDKHPEIEGCVCGGANNEHINQFRLCAERGIHMILMKVPTFDDDEYQEMLDLEKKYNVCCHIELEMHWKATIERIKDLIKGGAIGEVTSFIAYNYSHNPMWWFHWMDIAEESYGKRIPLNPGNKIFRGGALSDHPHIFDLVRYMFETDFDTVYAEAAPNMRDGAETEDLVYILGKLKNGIIVSLDPSYANREPEQARVFNVISNYPRAVQVEMEVHGTKGTIIADAYGADLFEEMTKENQYHVWPGYNPLDDQRMLFIKNFINNIRYGNEYKPYTTMEEHRNTIQTVKAAYESIYVGKTVKVDNK